MNTLEPRSPEQGPLPGEPQAAYARFLIYRNLGPARTLEAAYRVYLGDQAQSWVQQGPNQPVTGKQIQEALGTGALDQLASQAGMPPEKAASDLAEVLPVIVDKATPQGQLPAPAPQGTDVDDLLKQLLGGLSQPKS